MTFYRLLASLSLVLLCVSLPTGQAAQGSPGAGLYINEVMASNATTLPDGQGDYDDWIEIYNGSDAAINTAGMYLTDDEDEPTKWQFPVNNAAATTIPSHGYLLIWADGDTADPGLHADFKLSSNGEQVLLFGPDATTLIDTLEFGEQTVDISYGRSIDGGPDLTPMVYPTPGTANVHIPLEILSEPYFSHERGFYDDPFILELATDIEGATVFYTLNGDTPGEPSGRGGVIGTPYTEPIPITTTTCVRAVTMKGENVPSAVVTHTYIFAEDVIHQPARPEGFPTSWQGRMVDYSMDARVVADPAYRDEIVDDLKSTPSVCIVLPNDDLFGTSGIYSHPAMKGDAWEREASMEWIDPATGDDFGINAGLRIHGGDYSRTRLGNPKSGLQFFFRGQYGASKLEYPLFPDTDVDSFDRIGLREIWNYSWIGDSGMSGNINADYLRDVFARDTTRDMNGLTPHGRPIQVYINGLYWGLYIMTERIDDVFAADHMGGDPEDYDVLEAPSNQGGGTNMKVLTGDRVTVPTEWPTLFSLAETGDFSSSEDYEAIQEYVDIPAMIDYMMMIYYTGSRDAPVFLGDQWTPRNYSVVRRHNPDGPFYFVPWDVEWSLEYASEDRVGVTGVWNPHLLMYRLSNNPDFRMLVADHAYRLFRNDGALTVEKATERYLARADEIRGAIVGESARWGDVTRSTPYTRIDWQREVDRLTYEYFSIRTDIVLGQLRNRGWYPYFEPPIFQIDGQNQHGGGAEIGAVLSMVNPNSGGAMYFTIDGSDPRQAGEAPGPSDDGLTLIAENAAKRVLVPTGPVNDGWRGGRTFDDSSWVIGLGGVGYEMNSGYESYISTDVGRIMYGKNQSCYIRIPFDVSADTLSTIESLALTMRYDDGFVAYLNGFEVHRELFTGTPTWNSGADADHADSDVLDASTFSLTSYKWLLRPGANILAIQGLNYGETSSDMLITAELKITTPNSSGVMAAAASTTSTAIQYTSPLTLDASVQIKARTLVGQTWSALHESTFAVGPVAQNLRISEIMYHPSEDPAMGDLDVEFIELTNIGNETINLNLVKFTNGVDFTFGDVELASGEFVLVTDDTAAFEAAYGSGLPVAGQYTGRLDNGGERITLEDAAGRTIETFRYRDGWYDLTDGLGYSLTASDPAATSVDKFNKKEAWRPSVSVGGSPGHND